VAIQQEGNCADNADGEDGAYKNRVDSACELHLYRYYMLELTVAILLPSLGAFN
jgi:hypothetical protein